jgi:hypothetical protein
MPVSDSVLFQASMIDMSVPLGRMDLARLCAEVSLTNPYQHGSADEPIDLVGVALMQGLAEWLRLELDDVVHAPRSEPGTPEFAYILLNQMDHVAVMAGSFIMGDLALLCLEIARDRSGYSADVAGRAYLTGQQIVILGSATADGREAAIQNALQVASEGRRRGTAERIRTMTEKAKKRDAGLIEFATPLIAANRYISDRQLQRLYREENQLPTNSSNAEARRFAKLRERGDLPARIMMKDGQTSSY